MPQFFCCNFDSYELATMMCQHFEVYVHVIGEFSILGGVRKILSIESHLSAVEILYGGLIKCMRICLLSYNGHGMIL